jgi:hypothetical protein
MDDIEEYANSLTDDYFSECLDIPKDKLMFKAKIDSNILNDKIIIYYNFFINRIEFLFSSVINEENFVFYLNVVNEKFSNYLDTNHHSYSKLYPFIEQLSILFYNANKLRIYDDTTQKNIKYWKLLLKKKFEIEYEKYKITQKGLNKNMHKYLVKMANEYLYEKNIYNNSKIENIAGLILN